MIPALSDPDGAGFFDDLLPRCADLCYDSGMKACLSNKIGHLLALFCTVVWGVTFVASKRLLSFYTPAQLMFMRFVIAYAALWVLFPKWERPTLREELHYLLMGITGCSLYFWTENTALTITYAGNVSTIVALAPILTAIGAHFFTEGREKLNRWVWIGFGIAMLGVVLVVQGAKVIDPNGNIAKFAKYSSIPTLSQVWMYLPVAIVWHFLRRLPGRYTACCRSVFCGSVRACSSQERLCSTASFPHCP